MKPSDELSSKLSVLIDVLSKKKDSLLVVLSISENQESVLESEDLTVLAPYFKEMALEKQRHIDEILRLDNIFQALYGSIDEKFEALPENYKDQLLEIQSLITVVMDIDYKIRHIENLNNSMYNRRVASFNAPMAARKKIELMDKYKKSGRKPKF